MAREEGGKILIMALVLLVVGALLLTPLLGLMSTGLTAGQVYEKKMAALYACDAGIDDAIWRLVYTWDRLDDPYDLPQRVNGMDVTVEKLDERAEDDGVIVYTVLTTATRDGDFAGQVVAELRWHPMPFVEGSSPGEWEVPPTYVDVLTTLGPQTIAVGIPHGHGTAKFTAVGSNEPVAFGKNDLLEIDLAEPSASVYFRCSDYDIKDSDPIGDAHYYMGAGDLEFLLVSFIGKPNLSVGTNKLKVNQSQERDIVRIRVDSDDPRHGEADLFLSNMRQYFNCNDSIEIEALGFLDHGDGRIDGSEGSMLFALEKAASLASQPLTFEPYEVIMLGLGEPTDPDYPDPAPETFDLYLDTWTHILRPMNDNDAPPPVVALSPLPAWTWDGEEHPDGRLLLTFRNPPNKNVVGSDGRAIQTGDIAIWTPEGWQCDEDDDGEWVITDYGKPYSPDHPGTITLHIDLSGGDWFTMVFIDLTIISWTVEG